MRIGIGDVREREKKNIFVYIIAAAAALIAVFVFVDGRIRPFMDSVAKGYAENAVSTALNEMIYNAMEEEEYVFVDVIKDGEDMVRGVSMNSGDTNRLMAKIVMGLKKKIAEMEEMEAEIPLGSFFHSPIFSGWGPKVKVKFLILANTGVKAVENFENRGINQTLYTLSLHCVTNVGVYMAAMRSSVSVENDIPIAQILIVGDVPDSYTNVEGLEGTAQDAVMNID